MSSRSKKKHNRLEQQVQAFFSQPALRPGAYDLPSFMELEKVEPKVLDAYALHVLRRSRTQAEDERTRTVVSSVLDRFVAAVKPGDISRRCHVATYALLRTLEAAGVWAFAVQGTIKVEFDPSLHLEPQYFWTHDAPDMPGAVTGHYWLVAPPFQIIDVTARHQGWQSGEGQHVPAVLAIEGADVVRPSAEFHCAPEYRSEFPPPGPHHFAMWKWLPPLTVQVGTVRITNQPYAIRVPPPHEDLDGVRLQANGKTLRRFFDEEITPHLPPPIGA